jgi:hypothetical protein
MENRSATRQGTSYFVDGSAGMTYTRIAAGGTQNYNAEVRLQLDGQLGTLADRGAGRPGRKPPLAVHSRSAPVRADLAERTSRR